jgi:hypothetical protein
VGTDKNTRADKNMPRPIVNFNQGVRSVAVGSNHMAVIAGKPYGFA